MNADTPCWRDGQYVVVNSGVSLPRYCVKCARIDGLVERRESLTWCPRWALLWLVAFPVGIIVWCFFEEKVKVTYMVCPVHRKRRRIHRAVAAGLGLAGATAVFCGGYGWPMAVGIPLMLAAVYALVAAEDLRVTDYADGEAWLKGAGEAFLSQVDSLTGAQAGQ